MVTCCKKISLKNALNAGANNFVMCTVCVNAWFLCKAVWDWPHKSVSFIDGVEHSASS